ncbi:MAG: thermopsin family protease [Thermoplasmata archaeon]
MRRATAGVVVLIGTILIISALGLLSVAASADTHFSTGGASIGAVAPTPRFATGSPAFGPAAGAAPQTAPDFSSPLVERALAAAQAAGSADGRLMSLPHPPASPAEQAQTQSQGYVTPLYSNSPAPMGIADYGLMNGTGGSVIPYILNTTELQGNFSIDGAGLLAPTYTYFTDPGGYSVQQNAVLTNVTIWGNDTFQYWTQDTIYYNEILGEGTLVSDTWNWTTSTALVPPSSILAHGVNGSIQPGDALYFSVGPTFPLTYPFSISFTSKSLVNPTKGGEEELQYSALITRGATTLYNYTNWDYVVFNSTGGGSPPITKASHFTADGYGYNAVGLTDDFELAAGGPGGGSEVDLLSADATFSLDYLNATSSTLQAVPSAFNYAGETGETLTGGTVTWAGTPGSEYAVMTTGPSILNGLWNASGQSGKEAVTIDASPANAFVFVYPAGAATPFVDNYPSWAPLIDTTTIYLSPGMSYDLEAGLSNYDPASEVTEVLTAPLTWTATLTPDASQGIYTPLWAWTNAQLPSISSGGTGSPTDPYILVNDQSAPISSLFGVWNDWTFPVYSGVYLMNTTASVEIVDAAPMTVALPYIDLIPATNTMPYWFWQVSNVSIVDSVLPGTWWLDLLDVEYITEDAETPAEISFWNSSNNLVADNLIDYTVQGIFLYGGTDNTIWGNTIVAINPPATDTAPAAAPYNGITEAESGDLIYNNAFLDPYFWFPILAQEYEFNDFSGVAETNVNTWNVTPEAASIVALAPGFPQVPMVGSIADTSWQGGNFWADYGASFNPYGIPYDEDGYIALGNDSAPLPPGSLVGNVSAVEFTENGLPVGTSWSVTLDGWEIASSTSEISFFLTNGSYEYTVGAVTEFTASPASGSPLVSGVAQTIPIDFTSGSGTISGTVTPATATVTVDGTVVTVTGGAFSVGASVGVHSVVASAPGYVSYLNNVSVAGGSTTTVTIALTPTALSGYFAGTISPASATLSVDGHTETVVSGAFNLTLPAGFHAVEVSASGYVPYVALVEITGGATNSQTIALKASSGATPSSTYLSPLAYALIGILAALAVIFLIIAATRGRRSAPPAQSWSPGVPPPPTPPSSGT